MTKKQQLIVDKYVALFAELEREEDNEIAHGSADNYLLSAIEELGFAELSKAWEKVSDMGFWYA